MKEPSKGMTNKEIIRKWITKHNVNTPEPNWKCGYFETDWIDTLELVEIAKAEGIKQGRAERFDKIKCPICKKENEPIDYHIKCQFCFRCITCENQYKVEADKR